MKNPVESDHAAPGCLMFFAWCVILTPVAVVRCQANSAGFLGGFWFVVACVVSIVPVSLGIGWLIHLTATYRSPKDPLG